MRPDPGVVRQPADAFRPDLEGLRGVAILLVLLFHADLLGVTGGFIGVDVFFVLSGFLITGLLLRERERTGRIALRAFYARRARRILPAAAVVLLVTLAAAWFVLDPLDLQRVAGDAIAVALSVGNVRFALSATDYFASDTLPSPLLHYWSLGVEEQFYLLWPALLIVVMLVAARVRRPRAGAAVALALLAVVSCAAALALTEPAQAWAFYSLPTRAWQLALGGFLAAIAPQLGRVSTRLLAPVGWLGLAAIVAAALVIDPGTAYPGTAALVPALGAAAVIAAGEGRFAVGRLLAVAPMRFLGRISYSLYLVHWPLLVLPAAGLALDEVLPDQERAALAVLAIALGWASYRWIEAPIHRGVRFALPAPRTLKVAGAVIAICALASLDLGLAAGRIVATEGGAASVASVDQGGGDEGGDSAATDEGGTAGSDEGENPVASDDGATLPPDETEGPTPTSTAAGPPSMPSVTSRPHPSGPQPLPAGVRPSLGQASDDKEVLEQNGCTLGNLQVQLRTCVYGDPNGNKTVVLVGDSHAAAWFPAVQGVALARHWRLIPYTKLSCRFMDIRQVSRIMKREYTECETWRQVVIQRLQQLRPDLVIVTSAREPQPVFAIDADPYRQGAAMARLVAQIPSKVVILVDNPWSRFDVPACISGHVNDVTPCETSRRVALSSRYRIVETTAAKLTGATVVDLTPQICPYSPCPVVLSRMIVYRDSHHLTATFAASLAPALAARLPSLAPPPPAPTPSPSPTPAPPGNLVGAVTPRRV